MSQISEYSDIYDFIKRQEIAFRLPIPLSDSWSWSFVEHIKTSFAYIHSQLTRTKGEFTPVKNIIRPILNLQHRTEDIEVKDVQIYVDNPEKYHLSFLVKKYHDDVFVQEHDLDTYFDELNVSRIDYGAGLSKKMFKPRPEVVPLESIAFCDQTDMLSGPIGIKHFFSPNQLLEMEKVGWGEESNGATASIEDVIRLSREEKTDEQDGETTKTPGKYIEVYEVHGNLPKKFADKNNNSGLYENRLFICCFYQKKDSKGKDGVLLFTKEEEKSPFKLIKRDPVYGRALGFGGAEELFEPQVWVNYDMIRMQDMLDAASKTILISNDPAVRAKHPSGMKDMENLEIIDEAINGNTRQLDTFPRNLKLFENSVNSWEAHAQQMGAANDSIMGESPTAGTPFKLQELVTQESRGLHEYRRLQFAKHLEEVYRDWIIPHIQRQITKGHKFLSELSVDELQYVADCVARSLVYGEENEAVLNGELLYEGMDLQQGREQRIQQVKNEFKQGGNKRFIEILKGEFKDTELGVKVSVAGKSKNLAQMTDKIVNIFRFVISNPQGFAQVMQIPGMAKSWNEILEFSGMSPVDFAGIEKLALPTPQPQQSPMQPQMLPQLSTQNG